MPKSIHQHPYGAAVRLLIDIRKSKQITQSELAARLQKPQSYISKIELSERRVDIIELIDILRALGTAPEEYIEDLLALYPSHKQ